MSAGKFDPAEFFASPLAVAALVPADDVFGFLSRRVELPTGVAALVTRERGDERLCAPGSEVDGSGLAEVLFARAQSMEVSWTEERVVSADGFRADAHVSLRVTTVAQRGELSSFRDRVVGSSREVYVEDLARYLRAGTRSVLTGIAQERKMGVLVDATEQHAVADNLAEALSASCFAAGMTLDAAPEVRFESPTFSQVRADDEQAVRRRREQAAERQLQRATETAQREHLEHVEDLLDKLRKMADESPEAGFPDLLRTFSQSDRGELYAALFAAPPESDQTKWIVVAAGNELLFYDPAQADHPVRTVALSGEIGGVRSVQFARRFNGGSCLLVGAARGVYEIGATFEAAPVVYSVKEAVDVRGGVNSVALAGEFIFASHSELGLLRWQRDDPTESSLWLEEHTRGARAVRAVQFHEGRIYCSINGAVYSELADGATDASLLVYASSAPKTSLITALYPADDALYAGNSEGQVLRWSYGDTSAPTVLHNGGRPAESVHVVDMGGIQGIFFTDRSVAVHALVVGDTFSSRFEAGGQTLSRVEVAPDLLVSTNEIRDRLILWSPGSPASPRGVISVGRETGQHVQDVCLVPSALTGAIPT